MRFLITGGSSEIGFSIGQELYHNGHNIAFTYSSAKGLERIESQSKAKRIECELVAFNFCHIDESISNIESLFSKPIHGLILNACTPSLRLKRFGDLDLTSQLKWMQDNLDGNLSLLHKIVKHQEAIGFGRNIFISSVTANMGTSRYGMYACLKSGLEGLFRNLAVDYGHKNIFFNSVRPGIIKTKRTEKQCARLGFQRNIVSRIPSGRLGMPEQIAKGVLPMLMEESYINGTQLEISGGLPLTRSDLT